MLRDVNLIEYLPPFVAEYQEIKYIMSTENPEIQLVEDETEIIKNNQFILTCDLIGISRFEKLLGITPSKNDTLEMRISRVFIRWNDDIPYTYKVLIQKLTLLCGDDFEVIPNFNEYEMTIITHLESFGQVDELVNLLKYMIPCNIDVNSNNKMDFTIYGEILCSMGMAYCETFEISDAFKYDFKIDGDLLINSALIGTAEVIITEDFNETIILENIQEIGGAISFIENVQL